MAHEPAPRRVKTYTSTQGYVYQYYFVGKRAALPDDPESPATEFIFDVTADRKSMFAVSIFLSEGVPRGWASRHGRGLTEAEQYGAVKMRLFQAFDEIEHMMAEGRRLHVTGDELENFLSALGVQ